MPAVLKLTGTLLSQNYMALFIRAHPCETVIPCFSAKFQSVKGDSFEWPMTFYQALCCRGSYRRRQFRSQRGVIIYNTPHPTPAEYCFPFSNSRSHTVVCLNKSGYVPHNSFPSSWCQVRIPWFITAFQNLQITLWLGGYDGFCQKHEALCVGCHI